jgi:hypothetical protein
MKYLFLLLPFVALGQQPDKIKHYVAGASISAISYSFVAPRVSHRDALLISFATGVVAGVAKELYDPVFDKKDLAATVLGSFTFTITINLLSNQSSRRRH